MGGRNRQRDGREDRSKGGGRGMTRRVKKGVVMKCLIYLNHCTARCWQGRHRTLLQRSVKNKKRFIYTGHKAPVFSRGEGGRGRGRGDYAPGLGAPPLSSFQGADSRPVRLIQFVPKVRIVGFNWRSRSIVTFVPNTYVCIVRTYVCTCVRFKFNTMWWKLLEILRLELLLGNWIERKNQGRVRVLL